MMDAPGVQKRHKEPRQKGGTMSVDAGGGHLTRASGSPYNWRQ
jgi:hypothetical protein